MLFIGLPVFSGPVNAQAQSALERGQALVDKIAEPVFDAAETAPELRFKIRLVRGERPVALMVGGETAEISTGTFLLADHPEDMAAAIARILADKALEPSAKPARKQFTVRGKVPRQSSLRGGITSTDEAIARNSEQAAEETLKRRGGFGPPVEQIRAHAKALDASAVEILREAGLSADPLLHLYENMARAGEGLFERADYEGRRILIEQVNWLRERTAQADPTPRADFWAMLDEELKDVQAALR